MNKRNEGRAKVLGIFTVATIVSIATDDPTYVYIFIGAYALVLVAIRLGYIPVKQEGGTQ